MLLTITGNQGAASLFHKYRVLRNRDVLTSRNTLQVLAKRLKLSLDAPKQFTLEQANAKLTKSYQVYFKARPNFPPWREKIQMGLIKTLAKDRGRPIAQIEAQMKRGNCQYITDRQAKRIWQKNYQDPIILATATNSHGKIYEYQQEDTIVAAIAKSNLLQ